VAGRVAPPSIGLSSITSAPSRSGVSRFDGPAIGELLAAMADDLEPTKKTV
jgi:hypothetical protein